MSEYAKPDDNEKRGSVVASFTFAPGDFSRAYIARTCNECGFPGDQHWDFCPLPERERLARLALRPLWKKIIDRIVAAYEAEP
jgi:hypothetical protein